MSKPKTKVMGKLDTLKIPVYTIKGTSTLKTKLYYDFFYTHEMPFREPTINKIRANMIERDAENISIYSQLDNMQISKKRVLDTLSGNKPEKIVIETLCGILGISLALSARDYISNYDFEQKPICHKKGRKSAQDKLEFLEEYYKSWSIETVDSYLGEFDDNELCWTEDEVMNRIEEEQKKIIFKKLYDIYNEFPGMVQTFCNNFEYEDK